MSCFFFRSNRPGWPPLLVIVTMMFASFVGADPVLANDTVAEHPPRVTLVASADARHEGLGNARALAEVALAVRDDLNLVDRAEIEGALAEHELSLSGWLDGQWALEAGRVLPVDLFAVLTPPGRGRDREAALTTGLVVYDARTGLRLSDTAISLADPEAAAAGVSDTVQASALKSRALDDAVHTFGLVQVRNVGLPEADDGFVEAVGLLLERRLTASPTVAVLERRHLEHVTRERDLPTDPSDTEKAGGNRRSDTGLLASMVQLSLSLRQDEQNDKVVAQVLLRRDGERIDSVTVTGRITEAVELARRLQLEVLQAVDAQLAEATHPTDRVHEAERFAAESEAMRRLGYLPAALRTAQSAYALHPIQSHRVLLAQTMLDYANELLSGPASLSSGPPIEVVDNPGDGYRREDGPSRRRRVILISPADARRALGMGQRADQLLQDDGAWTAVSRSYTDFATLAASIRLAPDDLLRQSRDFRASALHNIVERIKSTAFRVQDEANRGHRVYHYINRLSSDARLLHALASDEQDAATITITLTDRLVEMMRSDQPFRIRCPRRNRSYSPEKTHRALLAPFIEDRYGVSYRVEVYGKDREAYAPHLHSFIKRLRNHPHPTVRLHADFQSLWLASVERENDEDHPIAELDEVIQTAREILDGPEHCHTPQVKADVWHVWAEAINLTFRSRYRNPEWESRYLAMWNEMLDRDILASEVLARFLPGNWRETTQSLELARRTLQMAQNPAVSVLPNSTIAVAQDPREILVGHMRHLVESIVADNPKPKDRPGTAAWASERTLLSAESRRLGVPVLVDDHMYVVRAKRDAEDRTTLELVRIALADGKSTRLGRVDVSLRQVQFVYGGVPSPIVHDGYFYQPVRDRGLAAFSLDGTDAHWIDEAHGLPSVRIRSMAGLGDHIYLGLDGTRGQRGMLVRYDPSTEAWKTLASAASAKPRNPLDGLTSLRIPTIAADPARERLIMVVYGFGYRHRLNGLWAFDPMAEEMTHLHHLDPDQSENLYTGLDSHMLLCGAHRVKRLNLETDDVTQIARKDRPMGRPQHPHAIVDGWLWSAHPFARTHLDTGQRELFPARWGLPSRLQASYGILPTSDRRVILASVRRIWIVELEK